MNAGGELTRCRNDAIVCCNMTAYLSRDITPRLARALRRLPVVVLSGLRQTGKSTLLQNEAALARGHTYRTLDDFATLAAARANPESLLEDPAILDEVQRCPELLMALKTSCTFPNPCLVPRWGGGNAAVSAVRARCGARVAGRRRPRRSSQRSSRRGSRTPRGRCDGTAERDCAP